MSIKSYFNEISTQSLFHLLNRSSVKIIDGRDVNAYNGWKLQNEKRGGHIKGAKSLPLKWSYYIDWIEIVRSKQIDIKNTIIIYSYSKEDSIQLASRFEKAGYKQLYIYNNFINEWASNENLPMNKLNRYKHLVSARWVKYLIEGKRTDEFTSNKFIICHSHYRNRDAYLSGHIPTAIDLDTLELESPKTWNRRSSGELKIALEKHGITNDTTVVLYGKYMSPNNNEEFPGSAAGHIGAIRCALIMMYAGVKDVRVLNGGFQAWQDEGFNIETTEIKKKPISNFGVKIPQCPNFFVDEIEAKEIIQSNNANLVCVRSWDEYIGKVSGYNYIKKKGRIPGVVFGNCGSDAYHMENYRNLDHSTREFQEIAKIWNNVGITSDKYNAFYCGTGWRGSEAFFNAWLMGWPKISVFDGGWFEWSNNPFNPYETGVPNITVESI
ncbi:MAG: hypothetical protein MI739_00830 [Bacteroidales bacterium]|nr:hypothetical protein [Bacteroidales bacterium]